MIVANNQESTYTTGENAAREALLSLTRRFPKTYAGLQVALGVIGFIANLHIMVWFAQWLTRVAGRVAQSALLLATLWVIINNVAHSFVAQFLSGSTIDNINHLSVIAFAIIPELILATAIQACYDHWAMVYRRGTWKCESLVWASLYTAPTIGFAIITVLTLSSFVSTEATSNFAPTATGLVMTIRFLLGWGYSLIDILFGQIGKKGYVAMLDNLRATIQQLRDSATEHMATIALLNDQISTASATHQNEIATLRANYDHEIATLSATHAQEIEALRATLEQREQELRVARERASRPRGLRSVALTRMAPSSAMAPATPATVSATHQHTHSATGATGDGYVAIDNGDSIAISDGKGATMIATGEPRERIKSAMLVALRNGEKINYKEIAAVANAGYSTVRKHAPAIIEELTATQV